MTPETLKNVLEAAMLAAGRALSLDDFLALFEGSQEAPDRAALRQALGELGEALDGRATELVEVASGYRLQVRKEYSPWLGGLFAERPPRYSRALLETLALIAYRQPITRGEIEDVRGVAVSSNIIKTLMEREWIRVLGHREVPGRPALFGTTREFLDHFGLRSLEGLPPLAEIRDLDQLEPDLFAPPAAHGDDDAAHQPGGVGAGGDDPPAESGDPASVPGPSSRTPQPGAAGHGNDLRDRETTPADPDDAAAGEAEDLDDEQSIELGGALHDEGGPDSADEPVTGESRRET